MIVTQQKPFEEILESLKGYKKVFLLGCGECATTCKSGGEPEALKLKEQLEHKGKIVTGLVAPESPCAAGKLKTALAKSMKALREAEVVLVLACGLGVQSFKENNRLALVVLPALDTLFNAVMDARGDFFEKCSSCGECVLAKTGGICPITLCSKGILNGPCGGMDKGRCEVDKDKDCAWVLIYKELEKRKKLGSLKEIQRAKDFKKATKPRKLTLK